MVIYLSESGGKHTVFRKISLFPQENLVSDPKIKFRWPLAVIVMVLIVLLTACKSKSTQVSSTSTVPVPTKAPVFTPIATLPSTSEPYILVGAVTTDSGLQYLEMKAGDGLAPHVGNIVKMNYIVTLPDGTVIYST